MTKGLVLLGLLLGGTSSALAEYKLNFQEPVNAIGREIYDLHMLVFWICVAIGIVVFSMMIISIIRHRKSKGAVSSDFHESAKVEVLWTIVPFIILIAVAIPATSTLLKIEDTSNADLTIKVTGLQWKWKYEYENGVSMISSLHADHNKARQLGSGIDVTKIDNYLLEVDNEMVIPVNKRVRFLLTSDDVIHSFWVPKFAVKKDAIPGYVNEAWTMSEKTGTFRGQCAELCGKDHAFMPIVVKVVEQAEYDTWLAMKKTEADAAAAEAASDKIWSKDELMAKGEAVYNGKGGCFGCHGANGEGIAVFPKLAGSAIAIGPAAAHTDIVVHGKPGTAMAAYANQLNDLEMAAVITYERNSWGNNASIVQPADVKAAR
jgi:cytochrome c oxidase subunit 2